MNPPRPSKTGITGWPRGTASDLHNEYFGILFGPKRIRILSPMTRRPPRSQPAWTDVKAKLAGLDRIGLMGLIQDLYAAHQRQSGFSSHPLWLGRGRSEAL